MSKRTAEASTIDNAQVPPKKQRTDENQTKHTAAFIPTDLFVLIFSFLPPGDLQYTIPLVSWHCNALVKESCVYRTAIFNFFPWVQDLDILLKEKGKPMNDLGKSVFSDRNSNFTA